MKTWLLSPIAFRNRSFFLRTKNAAPYKARLPVTWLKIAVSTLFTLSLAGLSSPVSAQANIRATVHNLSKNGPGTVKADSETQVCVFCHTPHGASTSAKTPLWNRKTSASATYTRYTSSSLDANNIANGFSANPGGSSLLCLSCHDGMVALGNVNVLAGQADAKISVSGSTTFTMPSGIGGYTRNLGTDLSNDHPISITYNSALVTADGEMRAVDSNQKDTGGTTTTGAGSLIGIRSSGYKPLIPLEPTGTSGLGQVQCASCHDPHITKEKFLRLNRYQTNAGPTGGIFNQANDIICLACHEKLGTEWANSAHANQTVADETYKSGAAALRGFTGTKKVWEVACLNCHDTHTVPGSRRLLREGVSGASATWTNGTLSATYQVGSSPADYSTVSALENTCFQCHNTTANRVLSSTATSPVSTVPDIWSEFNRAVRMPIKTSDQGGGGGTKEVHDIGGTLNDTGGVDCSTAANNRCGANFIESRTLLGKDTPANRHVECTDCHNPHRVIRNELFNAAGDNTKRTHKAGGTTANLGADGNVASGVLRGMWGVEPDYGTVTNAAAFSWPQNPLSATITYTVKSGQPSASTAKSSTYLTREYQLCLKCHSDYSNSTTAANFPSLRASTYGGTTSGTNGVIRYTNVAAEFAVNATDTFTGTDQGENSTNATYKPSNPNGAPDAAPTNHRSWHPVIFPTGRTKEARTNSTTTSFTNIRPPFNTQANIGKQTMQCNDCHGDPTSWTIGANNQFVTGGPDSTKTQGPHGSSENFLLKGKWDYTKYISDATGNTPTVVCGNCHDPSGNGGFSNGDAGHVSNSDHSQTGRCMYCHIALPHGWKNKAFLVNLNCLGPEVGKPAGCTSAVISGATGSNTGQLWKAPYYNGSILRINTWKASTAWTDTSCGTSTNNARNWMDATCQGAASTQQAQTSSY